MLSFCDSDCDIWIKEATLAFKKKLPQKYISWENTMNHQAHKYKFIIIGCWCFAINHKRDFTTNFWLPTCAFWFRVYTIFMWIILFAQEIPLSFYGAIRSRLHLHAHHFHSTNEQVVIECMYTISWRTCWSLTLTFPPPML